jgi:hypothetical protein
MSRVEDGKSIRSSNEIDESEGHSEKDSLPKCATDGGITIVINPEQQKPISLIRCKVED